MTAKNRVETDITGPTYYLRRNTWTPYWDREDTFDSEAAARKAIRRASQFSPKVATTKAKIVEISNDDGGESDAQPIVMVPLTPREMAAIAKAIMRTADGSIEAGVATSLLEKVRHAVTH